MARGGKLSGLIVGSVAAFVLCGAGLTFESPRPPAIALHQLPQNAARFPLGTALVASDVTYGRTYFTTEVGWDSIAVSADGRQLILLSYSDSCVLDAVSLDVQRRLSNSQAWWEGSRLGYFDYLNVFILTGGRTIPANIGRTEIVSANPNGRFFLGQRKIRHGTIRNGNTPTHRLQLWERTKNGKLKFSRDLATATYDPASEENPRRLEVLNGFLAVFGFPNGFADGEDFVAVVHGHRVTAPLKDEKGRPLQFTQSPVIAGNAIIGLAEAVAPPFVLTGERFFYRVTATTITVRRVAPNVVFVTYDPKHRAVGWGVSGRDGVEVKYDAVSVLAEQVGSSQAGVPHYPALLSVPSAPPHEPRPMRLPVKACGPAGSRSAGIIPQLPIPVETVWNGGLARSTRSVSMAAVSHCRIWPASDHPPAL
jgi:hypothetical protein